MAESRLDFDDPPDAPEEACGVFGVVSANGENVAKLTYFGLYALQHRGQESAGISTFEYNGTCHTFKDMGLVSQVFNEQNLTTLPGHIAIGHNRYSTTGSSKITNAQPIVLPTPLGSFALAHNGNLVNTEALRSELLANGHHMQSSSDSECIAHAIAEAATKNWIDSITTALQRCQGAFSLVIGTPKGIVGARDGYGIRPLVIGKTADGSYVLASETCGLDIIGAEYIRDVNAGELVWIDQNGITSHQWLLEALPKLCVFEMIYFARPDSIVHGESLYSYRMRLGKSLAQEAPVEADLVIGVPDSGIPAAIGYSQTSGIPFAEGLIKNRYVGRTFIQPTKPCANLEFA